MDNRWDFCVVGAGAAGLMAAGQAASRGLRVLLLDRNARVGRKIMITGKGRCNLTNDCSRDRLQQAVRRNPRFLFSAFDAFSPQDTMAFFEARGVPLKVERGRRVFPQSDRAVDIVDALYEYVRSAGVVLRQSRVGAVEREADGFLLRLADGGAVSSKAVLIATGGLSYPLTGSTGDGYRFAEAFGHTVTETGPSLIPIELEEPWCADLMGLSLRNVTLTVRRGKRELYSELGECMFTHFGLSGPLVLSASSYLDGDLSRDRIEIDLKPGLSAQQLDARILRDFADAKNRSLKNALDRLLPRSIIPQVIAQSGVAPDTPVHSVTREQRLALAGAIKRFALTPKRLRPVEEAVVTRGGVNVSDVSPKTMESKLVKGLYFAGEVLDLDAVTGGFNLQIAFSTGYVAGNAAADAQSRQTETEKEVDTVKRILSVAIDGPSAAGKSTTAKRLAAELGAAYVDTGAMYRAIGCHALRSGAATDDAEAVAALLPGISLDLRYENGAQKIFLNGEDVSEEIRRPEMSMAASNVSAIPAVRAFLLEQQRAFAKRQSVVMDGRDIGTVVLPDADVKFFLTASPEARARRRMEEYAAKGETVDFEDLLRETILRDRQDSERAAAPLRQAEDAILVDNTDLGFEETIAAMLAAVREKMP